MYEVAEGILEGTGMTAVQTIGGANVNRQHEALKKKKTCDRHRHAGSHS